jgi:hypothetical protein
LRTTKQLPAASTCRTSTADNLLNKEQSMTILLSIGGGSMALGRPPARILPGAGVRQRRVGSSTTIAASGRKPWDLGRFVRSATYVEIMFEILVM